MGRGAWRATVRRVAMDSDVTAAEQQQQQNSAHFIEL